MQNAVLLQAFDGRDRLVYSRGEGQAGQYPAAPDEHRTRTALPVVTSLLGSCQAESLSQGIQQGGTRIHFHALRKSVDRELDNQTRGRFFWP